ncbi:phosphoribosylaminoimidazole-succinocarboxamide synthase [Klebsiella variicola]|nr:phosphoribosylaminoimidazole-succinocarboxamide synthase [Klebsiella variicola]
MHDPMVNDSYCETFGWVSKENLARMRELTYKANDVLKKLFDDAGLILVDFKLEFGSVQRRSGAGRRVFGRTAAVCGIKTPSIKWTKDRFRQSLGGLIEAYEEVAHRLGVKLD